MAHEQSNARTKSYRRFLRVSLRSFLLALTILCVWLGIQVSHAHKQRAAVAAIRNLGGSVSYDYQKVAGGKPNQFESDPKPPGPDWLRSITGPEYFQDVIMVELSHRPIT